MSERENAYRIFVWKPLGKCGRAAKTDKIER
jgi:hypothetical protein